MRTLLLLACAVTALPAMAEPRPFHLGIGERASVDEALARGVDFLVARQNANGAFPPSVRPDACPVALTAMALWALSSVPVEPDDEHHGLAAAEFLLGHAQPDGGIYDPDRGLGVYTSGVAARALRAYRDRHQTSLLDELLPKVELFVYRETVPESIVDVEQATGTARNRSGELARELLDTGTDLSSNQQRALDFLARAGAETQSRRPVRTRVPGWRRPGADLEQFSYDDLLPFVYRPMKPEHQIARRAREAVRSNYTLDRNPDLTRRYGQEGFQRTASGLYYYYLVLAKTISLYEDPYVSLPDGRERDWVRELKDKLVSLQRTDGSWVNDDGHWWEDEPILVTSYALLALRLCRDMEQSPRVR